GSKRLRAVRVVVKIEDVGDSLTLSEDAATSEDASLSLHDALPISHRTAAPSDGRQGPKYSGHPPADRFTDPGDHPGGEVRPCGEDRKSTRLNSSHVSISYAVFCVQKKTRDRNS